MGKRNKGKGKGRKRQAVTRRGAKAPASEGATTEAASNDEPPEDAPVEASSPDDDDDDEDVEPAPKARPSDEASDEAGEKADPKAAAGKTKASTASKPAADGARPVRAASTEDDSGSESGEGDDEVPESTVGLPDGAAWALPLVKLEHRWTWFEVRLMFGALMALMLVLVFWAAMGSMADSVESLVVKGTLFRQIVGASVLALVVRLATHKRLDERWRNWATVAAVVAGVLTAKLWRGMGIEFFSGFNDWLQKGSVFALFGGLKGVSTRLTMFVSLLGGSLAAAAGTHIAIDAVLRLIPKNLRRPSAVVASLATAVICFMASWGFYDHMAVTAMGSKLDTPTGEKISLSVDELGDELFLLRKQLLLDLRTFPRVLGSGAWNDPKAFTGRDWNTFIEENGFRERYGEEGYARLKAAESDLESGYQPFVKVPDGHAAGRLLTGADLMWALGFLMIGLRFVLRAVLIVAGHVKLDIEAEITEGDDLAGEGAS